jgi:hypothetical protein
VRRLVLTSSVFTDLTLKSRGALRFVVAHDYYAAFWVVFKLDGEAGNSFWRLWDTLLAVDVRVRQECDFPRGVSAREVEGGTTTLRDAVRAEDGCSTLAAEDTSEVLEFIVREEEVVELAS